RHDGAAGRESQSVARGRLHAVQPGRRLARHAGSEWIARHSCDDREIDRASLARCRLILNERTVMTSTILPKTRIAHLAGPTATIQNTPPLVTSNKARAVHGLPPRMNADGTLPAFDALRPQRLAAPAKVYVEQFSAHPLES